MVSTENKNINRAVAFALLSSIFAATVGLPVKLIGGGLPTNEIVFARYLIGFILLTPWIIRDKNLFIVQNKELVILRSLVSVLGTLCVYAAYNLIPISNAVLLRSTNTLFIPVLALLFLQLKTSPKIWLCIFVGFVGVTLVLHPSSGGYNWGSILGLLSGILGAISLLTTRVLTERCSPVRILYFMQFNCMVLSGLSLPFSFQWPNLNQLFLLLLAGVVALLVQIFTIFALRNAISRVVSPIFYSTVLFSAFYDWYFWHHLPKLISLIGMVLIIIAGLMIVLLQPKRTSIKNA